MPKVHPKFQQQRQQNHGIPVVPLVKRSPNSELMRPVVFMDCEMDPIELPFGGEDMEESVRVIRLKRRRHEASARVWRACLIVSLILLFAVVAWYFGTVLRAKGTVRLQAGDSPEDSLDDLYSPDSNEASRRLQR